MLKMLRIFKKYNLKKQNAFKLDVIAEYFVSVTQKKDLKKLAKRIDLKTNKHFILGSGFNTLFTGNFNGLIIHPNIGGIVKLKENKSHVWFKVGAGVDWTNFVKFAVSKNLSGIENLNLIPGSVGAAPVQNIAAYGQNFEDVFVSLTSYDIIENKFVKFNKSKCKFAYRDSFFKRESNGRYVIIDVTIKLSKIANIDTSYHSRYGGIVDELNKFTKPPYNVSVIAKAVGRIRRRKFPNWNKFGTAGSFFLNPFVSKEKLSEIQKIAPGVQFYPIEKTTYPPTDDPYFKHISYVKIAAGWLLEEIGWRGKRIGNVSTSPNQALVVISHGKTSPNEILSFTKRMQDDFEKAYGIKLEPEVNII